MGIIGIHEELLIMPLTPIKTPSTCTSRKRKEEDEEDIEAASSCRTPKSESSPTPPRCPPPPAKPRPVKRKFSSGESPKLGFFQVPEDLASVFRLIAAPNKKIRTS